MECALVTGVKTCALPILNRLLLRLPNGQVARPAFRSKSPILAQPKKPASAVKASARSIRVCLAVIEHVQFDARKRSAPCRCRKLSETRSDAKRAAMKENGDRHEIGRASWRERGRQDG